MCPASDTPNEQLEAWKQGIETQMHFAQLSLKMRQIGLTLAGAALALAVVLYRAGAEFSFAMPTYGFSVPISSLLCLASAVILYAAKKLDADMYHQMLRGAVRFNELMERKMDAEMRWAAGLTETISAYSRFRSRPELLAERNDKGEIWRGDELRLAGNRIAWFYYICIIALAAAAFGFFAVDNFGQVVHAHTP